MTFNRTMSQALLLTLGLVLCSIGMADAQLSVSLDVNAPTCAGYTNGSIYADASGGTRPYNFQWSNGAISQGIYGLSAGSFTVTVSDATGATATATTTLAPPPALTLSSQVNGDICSPTATYTLLPSGGVAPYTYTLDGVSSGATTDILAPGFHYARVTDANGCEAGTGIKVAAPLDVFVRTDNVVCHGYCDGTVEAKISGGTAPHSFLWNTGDTTQLVYNLDPGTYTVVVTDANGCQATASGTLTEPDSITFSVMLEDSCVGGTFADIVAQGGTGNLTIEWSTGTIGPRAYLPEGQHFVTVTDENGCQVSDGVLVSDGFRTVTTMNTDATCDEGGEAMLCITGGKGPFTILWSDGQTGVTAVDLAPGVYTFTLIDAAGCRFDGSTIILGPDPSECDDCVVDPGMLIGGMTTDSACTTITLTATVATPPVVPAGFQVAYILTGFPVTTILGVSPNPTFDVIADGMYSIHTFVYDPATFDINSIIIGTTMANDIFLQLIAGGGDICAALDIVGTQFTVPPCQEPEGCIGGNPGALIANPVCFDGVSATLVPSVSAAPVVPADYQVIYILSGVPGDVVLAVSPTPNFDVTAVGMYSIRALVFHPDSLDLGAVLVPGTTTLPQLEATLTECDALGGQPAAAQFDVQLFDPQFATGLADMVCPGDMATLNPNGDASFSYQWSPADLLNDPTAVSPVATVTETTTFTVEISQQISGVTCSATRTYTVTVDPLPSLTDPADVATCDDEPVALTTSTSANASVEWSDVADFSNIISSDASLVVTPGEPTTYYVRATNATGCSTEQQVLVGSYPVAAETGEDYTICEGDQASINVDGTLGNPNSFTLFNGAGTQVDANADGAFAFTPQLSDSYQVIAVNSFGCADTVDIAIDLSSVEVQLLAGMSVDTAIYPGNGVDLTALSDGAISFDFNDETELSYTTIGDSTATVEPTATSIYSVTGTNEFGCQATAQLTVTLLEFVCDRPFLFVPNAFSPDDDKINDVFYIDGVNVTDAYYAIYNRWGQQVFESSNIGDEDGWDGTFNGQVVEPDVYGLYVRVVCNDGEEFYTQGNVTVLR